MPLSFAVGIDGLGLHCYCSGSLKGPLIYSLYIRKPYLLIISEGHWKGDISSSFNSRSLGLFSYLSWHGRSSVRKGEAGTNNESTFIPRQKAQCKDLAGYINTQSRLIS